MKTLLTAILITFITSFCFAGDHFPANMPDDFSITYEYYGGESNTYSSIQINATGGSSTSVNQLNEAALSQLTMNAESLKKFKGLYKSLRKLHIFTWKQEDHLVITDAPSSYLTFVIAGKEYRVMCTYGGSESNNQIFSQSLNQVFAFWNTYSVGNAQLY